jgi:hypothetical protein
MAVRFLDEGYEYLDPMSGANPMGSVLVYDDGTRMPPYEDRPGYGQNDLIASEALRWMETPRERLAMQGPPVPQVLFPPQFGYVHEPPTIWDIADLDMWQPTRRSWAAPTVRTLRRGYEEDMWSGTERNMSTSVNPML